MPKVANASFLSAYIKTNSLPFDI